MHCYHCNLDITREPVCTVCYLCGMIFCAKCHLKEEVKNCPACNQKGFKTTEEKGLKKLIQIYNQKDPHPNLGIIASSIANYYISKKNFMEAYEYVMTAGKLGVPYAQNYIGYLHLNGYPEVNNKKDYKLALHWITISAENDYPEAFYYLGMIYKKGLGVPKDPHRSTTCYLLGAMKGDRKCKEKLKK